MVEFPHNRVVDRETWLAERTALLRREKEMTRALDRLREERRALPLVRVEKDYVFDGPDGPVDLAALFRGRSQLAIYSFMLSPGSDHICSGCAFLADHIDAARQHFENADLSFAAASRAPVERIEQVKRRLGWRFPWVSSGRNDYGYDFGTSFRPEDIAAGRAIYNFDQPVRQSEDLHGTNVFVRDEDGAIYHAYATFGRGNEMQVGAFMWLDLVPGGRFEDTVMNWVRLHDEYEPRSAGGCCAA